MTVSVLDKNGSNIIYPISRLYNKLSSELTSLTKLFLMDLPNVTGTIPSSIGKLTQITQLWISNTNISGPIPNFLAQLTELNGLSLCNKHTGPIPQFIGKFKNLVLLFLSSNKLSGPIPIFLTQLKELAFLDLSDNKLTGPIPLGLAQLTKLNNLKLGSNALSGPIPNFLGQYPSLTTLSLSHNQLSGPIPTSLGRAKITFLELNHNKLTGDASFLFDKENLGPGEIHINNNFLKFEFSNVEMPPLLWSFNISHNMIYGSLPKWLGEFRPPMGYSKSSMTSMFSYTFDVSYNQLCGPIPNGQLFRDASIFAHNKCLCVGPLSACK
ncbi:uncharacterized protein LOC141649948 [Silene latifolia]|uniref:uncharacterized protein LOC141649948 n=1 Tax=Silene latifolia TaxID=37657 RepID=UPI003D77AEC6